MTIVIACKRNPAMEVTLEWDKPGVIFVRVYENWGGEWHNIYESRPYAEIEEEKAKATYKRYVKKYIK